MRLTVCGKDIVGSGKKKEYVVCVESKGKRYLVSTDKSRWKRACIGNKVEVKRAELAAGMSVEECESE